MSTPRTSTGSPFAWDVVVAFFKAPQLRGSMQVLDPQKQTFRLQMIGSDGKAGTKEIRFDQIKMLGVLRKPGAPEAVRPPGSRVVTIRFMDDRVIRGISEPSAGSSVGMFIVPLRAETLERVFIPLAAIREVLAIDELDDPADEPSILSALPTDPGDRSAPASRPSHPGPLREVLAPPGAPAPQVVPRGASLQPPAVPKKLGEILLEQRFLDQALVDEALAVQETQSRKRFGEILVELGFATHKTIAVALAIQWGVPFVDLSKQKAASHRLVAHVPAWFARRWRVMPISEEKGVLTVAVTDPIDHKGILELRQTTGLKVAMVIATPQDITRAIAAYYPRQR